MKKTFIIFFVICSLLCTSSGAALPYLFGTDATYCMVAFCVFSASVLVSILLAILMYRKVSGNISCYAQKHKNDLLSGEYITHTGFKYATEFKPFVDLLATQSKLIDEQVIKLTTERNTIKTITDNMNEGLILLDSDFEILTFNKSAVPFLDSQTIAFENDRLIKLAESSFLYESVKKALSGEVNDFCTEIASKTFQIFSNPVRDEKRIYGVVVFCVDITHKLAAEESGRLFTTNVSHELKTPLTSISGYAEMMANGMVSEKEDIIKFSGIIHKETARLIKLTSDIVRLSEIETNMLPPNDEALNLGNVFDSVAETLELAASKNDVSIINALENEISFIANRSLIEELVFNLCENAVKYNKPGGNVTLTASENLECIEIKVTDTGIGIPEDQTEKIFNKFWRVDKSRSKQTGGTGLGLSIVKQIAEYYSGSVSCTSSIGNGTSITVKLYPEINRFR